MEDNRFDPGPEKPKLELELQQLWNGAQVPGFEGFLEEIDAALMDEMRSDPFGIALDIFNYFDSEEKPLNPREFLHFWVSLTDEDRTYYILETTEPLTTPGGIATILGSEAELIQKIFPGRELE